MKEQYQSKRKEDAVLYKIGLFSKMNRVTVKTLRHYDDIGLLKPAYVDESSGYRYYTSSQLPSLHQILALRQMGFTLEEIREVQNGMSEEKLLKQKKSELIKRIAEETMKLSQVECYLLEKDIEKGYRVVLKELPEIIVASMRRIIPDYGSLLEIIPVMDAEVKRLSCIHAVPEYCFNIYHDGEYKESDIDVEVCESVTEKREDSKILTFKTMKKVEAAACVLHKGSYSNLPKAYAAILKWIEENGFEIAGNARESYIDGMWNKDSEADWLTEVQFPVRKIK